MGAGMTQTIIDANHLSIACFISTLLGLRFTPVFPSVISRCRTAMQWSKARTAMSFMEAVYWWIRLGAGLCWHRAYRGASVELRLQQITAAGFTSRRHRVRSATASISNKQRESVLRWRTPNTGKTRVVTWPSAAPAQFPETLQIRGATGSVAASMRKVCCTSPTVRSAAITRDSQAGGIMSQKKATGR